MSDRNESLAAKLDELEIDRGRGERRSTRPFLWFFLIAVLGGGGALALYLVFFDAQNLASVETSVARTIQTSAPDDSVLNGTGYVVARRQAAVSAKTTGKVLEVYVEEGMQVTEGQLLAKLDDKLPKIQIELSQANLDHTKAQLRNVDIRRDDAERTLRRVTELRQGELVAQSEFDRAVLDLAGANAEMELLNRAIAVAEKQLELQNYYVEETEIRAPFAGIVIAKTAQPGEMISPVSAGGGFTRTGICTIVDMDSIEVEVDVQERFINRVSPGQQASVTLNAYSDTQLPAEVIAIIPAADRGSSTVRVRIGFLERDERVLPDMAVSVAFLEEGREAKRVVTPKGVEIPVDAVFHEGELSIVWVLKDESVERRIVEVEETNSRTARISKGLERGETVVTNLPHFDVSPLVDGQRVRISQ